MKILNLYSGLGGNRQLWGNEHEITAIEINSEIASTYKELYPEDTVIVTDAHEYLLKHFKEFDFIWSSPPCPTHSRLNFTNNNKKHQKITEKYPDMKLYEEIIFLKTWFKGKYVVENVISYYDPLIEPFVAGGHYFWSNFIITNFLKITRCITTDYDIKLVSNKVNISIEQLSQISNKRKALNNCTEPELGLHVFKCVVDEQDSLFNF